MATNYIGPGDVMEFTADGVPEEEGLPVVFAGTPYLIGNLLVVATSNAHDGETFRGKVGGVWDDMPKATGQTWDEGELLYWDDDAGEFTPTADGNTPAGCAAASADSEDATGRVRLSGIPAAPIFIET